MSPQNDTFLKLGEYTSPMGFAIIVDNTADYGFLLRGDTNPPDHLFPTVEAQLRRDLSPSDFDSLEGQHIGYATDEGHVSLNTQYQRGSTHAI